MFHDRKDIWWKIALQHSLIIFDRRILSAFAFRYNHVIAAASHNGFDVHPSAMKRCRNATRGCWTSAKLPYFRLEFRSELSALYGVFAKQLPQVGVLHVGGCGLESILAVAAGLDQIVQIFD